MVAGLHSTGYFLVWAMYYLTLNISEDVYHKLVEEMRERVGYDQGHKLRSYAYDTNTYVMATNMLYMHTTE